MWKYGTVVLGLGGLLTGVAQAQAAQSGCQPIKGKILSTLDPITSRSLGVASVVIGGTGKLTCALTGTPLPPNPQDPTRVAFIDTISCDDVVNLPSGPLHSRLLLNSSGHINPTTGFFTETSIPDPSTAAGLFQGVTAQSFLSIEGRVFPATGAFDLTFTGQVCYGNAP
jgi:hypothetical protein